MREKIDQTERNQQLTEEELQRTQVLNLADFQEAARIEKLTSKKPAIIVAIIGFLSISLGTIMPAVQSLQARKEKENASVVSARKEPVLKQKEEVVTCTKKSLNLSDGSDQIFEINYTFENNELIKAQKTYSVIATDGKDIGKKRVEKYSEDIKPFHAVKSGYETSVKNITGGVMSVIDINYEILKIDDIPKANQSNSIYKSDYKGKESKQTVISQNEEKGFKCSGDIENTAAKPKVTSLKCTFKDDNRSDGVDYLYEINYSFENNKLVSAKKTFTMTPTKGSEIGTKTVTGFKNSLAQYNSSINGYTAISKEENNSVSSIIDINYNLVQLDSIPEKNKGSFIYKADFPAGTTKEEVINQSRGMVIPGSNVKGFTCK